MTISARGRPAIPRSAWSGCSLCSPFSMAISVTPISPRTGCGPGGISGRTTAAAPASVPGCPPPAITRTNWVTGRSGIGPIRQTYFSVPESAGQTDVTRGLWYAFTAGSMRVISIANDDICYQDGGNSYVRGYSSGAQKVWLENELATARENHDVDWVVVCMHQVAISTADMFNGADLWIREEWVPLFDKYGVDLVVCGHEHHYESSHPLRGCESNATLTPVPAATATDVIDTSKGTVHMVIGGGGTSVPSNQLFFNPPACRVITAVGAPDPKTGKRPPVYVKEDAPWSAVRNAAHSYGFAAFTVDPGSERGGITTIKVTYYDVVGADGRVAPSETFTLRRPRRD